MANKPEEPFSPELEELANLVAELREQEVLSLVDRNLADGVSPEEILGACQKGMHLVGKMHEEGHYFIAGLIMAGEIMRQVMDLIKPVMTRSKSSNNRGRVLLGTIQGDIHDIGKNLFRDLLECHGFTVLDLGVDVPPARFLQAVEDFNPHLVGVSALITESFPRLRELVKLFEEASLQKARRPLILIGGGQVDDVIYRVCGSDYWARDVFAGVKLCQRIMSGQKRRMISLFP